MPSGDPTSADAVAALSARLEAAERALAERDKTIAELLAHDARHFPEPLEDHAALQAAVARKTQELEAQNRELERSKEIFSTAFEHAPIGVALVSPEGRWLKVNRALCEVVGYSEAELLARTFQDITHPDDLELDLECLRRCAAGEISSYQIEKRYFHGRGHVISVLLSVSAVRDDHGQPLFFVSQIQDISARKKAEAEVRASEEKLRQIFEHSTQVFYSHTADGQITYISPRVREILDCSADEALQPWTDFLTGNPVNSRGIAHTNRAIETGLPQPPYPLEIRSKTGRKVWVEVHESPVVVDGKTVALVGALTDITLRRETQARQRAEEARFIRQRDALITFAATSATQHSGDITGTIRRLTETAATTLGVARVSVWRYNADRTALRCVDLYELEADRHSEGIELAGTSFPGYFAAMATMDVIAADDAHRDPRTCEFSEAYLRPLGITSMLDAPIHLGGIAEGVLCHEHIGPARAWTVDEQTFAVAVAGRVSLVLEGVERQRARQELRSAHAQLEQMLAHSAAIIYRLKVSGDSFVPLAVSANITRILGYPVADVLHANWWPAQLHPEDRERMFAASAQAIHQSAGSKEYRVRHHDGGYRWIEDHQRVLSDADGRPVEIIGVWTDITARKEAEAALAKSHRELLGLSRQAGMAEVATSVLHNVGNVLNSVNVSAGCAQDQLRKSRIEDVSRLAQLLQGHAADLPGFFARDSRGATVPDFLARLGEHLRHEQKTLLEEMESLIANIDHIKNIVAMQQSYARVSDLVEALPPAELVEIALRLNAGSFDGRGVKVERDFAEVPPILVEKHKVIQVLVNLLRNARHAFAESSETEKRIILRIRQKDDGFVQIIVTDNGIGIPAENLTRVFAHGFTTRRDGHGFGLHSGALAAQELGGALYAESAGPGQGATFTLELPTARKPADPRPT